jgi:NNP family nitrate/nitrite transporter-like MFS transporter
MTTMRLKEFARSGNPATLLAAFLYFDVSFMVWVLVGALGIYVSAEFSLTATGKGFLVALPILSGSVLRVVLGLLVDRIGPRRVGIGGMLVTCVPLLLAWSGLGGLGGMIVSAILLGIAGASFAVALPLASRWYPPAYQGLAMGIAAAGNSGTVIAAFFAPRLAEILGWRGVFGASLVPIAAVLGVYACCAKEAPNPPAPRRLPQYLSLLREADTWWLSLLYMVTFGGFVGMASFLPIFFFDQYAAAKITAGNLTAAAVFAGSFSRPFGGFLADRFGGVRVLTCVYAAVAVLMLMVSRLPALPTATVLVVLAMATLGIGNGSVFQLVPQRFHREIGTATGIVGAAGGLGGFALPSLIGVLKDATGSYAAGLFAFALAALAAVAVLLAVQGSWRSQWVRDGVEVAL